LIEGVRTGKRCEGGVPSARQGKNQTFISEVAHASHKRIGLDFKDFPTPRRSGHRVRRDERVWIHRSLQWQGHAVHGHRKANVTECANPPCLSLSLSGRFNLPRHINRVIAKGAGARAVTAQGIEVNVGNQQLRSTRKPNRFGQGLSVLVDERVRVEREVR
jgi:hypothetical protein